MEFLFDTYKRGVSDENSNNTNCIAFPLFTYRYEFMCIDSVTDKIQYENKAILYNVISNIVTYTTEEQRLYKETPLLGRIPQRRLTSSPLSNPYNHHIPIPFH